VHCIAVASMKLIVINPHLCLLLLSQLHSIENFITRLERISLFAYSLECYAMLLYVVVGLWLLSDFNKCTDLNSKAVTTEYEKVCIMICYVVAVYFGIHLLRQFRHFIVLHLMK